MNGWRLYRQRPVFDSSDRAIGSLLPLPLGNGYDCKNTSWALAQFLNDTLGSTSMSFVRIWVHAVFSTRNHEQYFDSEIRRKLIEHIKINCRNKEIFLDSIGWLVGTPASTDISRE